MFLQPFVVLLGSGKLIDQFIFPLPPFNFFDIRFNRIDLLMQRIHILSAFLFLFPVDRAGVELSFIFSLADLLCPIDHISCLGDVLLHLVVDFGVAGILSDIALHTFL
jgi:hypothetical protein